MVANNPSQRENPWSDEHIRRVVEDAFAKVVLGTCTQFDATQELVACGIGAMLAADPVLNPDGLPLSSLSFVVNVRVAPGDSYLNSDSFSVSLWNGTEELGEALGDFSRSNIGFAHPTTAQLEVLRELIQTKVPSKVIGPRTTSF